MSIKRFFPDARPTLDLNFAATKRLDPRITYTRASTGTFVGSNGLIQSAAVNQARFEHSPLTGESLGLLAEEARTNVATYSDQLANAIWTKAGLSIFTVNTITAPDGTLTGSFIAWQNATSPLTSGLGLQYGVGIAAGTSTLSCFAKMGTARYLALGLTNNSGETSTAIFDLQTGTVNGSGSHPSFTVQVTSISNAGSGWYKCSLTSTYSLGMTSHISSSTSGLSGVYGRDVSGDGTSGIYIWGPQIEAGFFPTSRIPTPATFTGRASTATFYDSAGIVQTAASGIARSNAFFPDENRIFRPAGLLIEAAGTNLLNHSQTFATSGGTQNNWADTNVSRDVTLRTSPDGTANALRITASAANATIISSSGIGTSAARSLSIFLRRVTGSGAVEYTLDNGSTYTPQAVTSSWVRYAFPATTADQQVGIRLVTSGNAIELWGAQLEAGASATSYIPTTTTTVTRSADTSTSATVTRAADVADITGANFSSWFNASSGSLISIAQTPTGMSWNYQGAQLIGGFTAGGFRTYGFSTYGFYASGVLQTGVVAYLNGVGLDIMGGLNIHPGEPLISPRNGFMSWSATEGIFGINGFLSSGASSSGASLISARVNKLVIGHGDGIHGFYGPPATVHIKRLSFYPSRLSNATLQSLTR